MVTGACPALGGHQPPAGERYYRAIGTGAAANGWPPLSEDWASSSCPLVPDVQDKAATRAAIEGCRPNGNRRDLLVNNAGLALGWSLPTRQT